jgi:uncharacterized protein YkwD
MTRSAVIALLVVVLAGIGPATLGPGPADAQGSATDPVAARVVELTNAERQQAGLGPLGINPQLSLAAQRYAEAMASSGCFSHTCAPEPELAKRAEGAGYTPWGALAENIAAGQRSPEQALASWMASPGHRANVLRAEVSEIGVGRAPGGPYGIYWVQVFGAPRGGPLASAPGAAEGANLLPPDAACARLVELLNAERVGAGLAPLSPHPALSLAAQGYAEVLAGSGCFGSACGPTPPLSGRVEAAGYLSWTALTEALAAGQATPEEVATLWIDRLRTDIVDPRYTDVGVGVAYGGTYRYYWATTFGAARE